MTMKQDDVIKATGLSKSQLNKARAAGIDTQDIKALKAFRKTINTRSPSAPKEDKPKKKGRTLTVEEIALAMRAEGLSPVEARGLKIQLEGLAEVAKLQKQVGLLISRSEAKEAQAKIGHALKAMMKRLEKEIPAICLGLPLSQSTPLVIAKFREVMQSFCDQQDEFWKENPEL